MKLFNLTPARRKALLVYPVIVIPGLCLMFSILGGGRGGDMVGSPVFGLNPELPKASVDGRELLNKKLQYEQAERDSIRKAQYRLQDPYRHDSAVVKSAASFSRVSRTARLSAGSRAAVLPAKPVIASDPRADQVLKQLQRLREVIRQPASPAAAGPSVASASGIGRVLSGSGRYGDLRSSAPPDDTVGDARIGRLNEMLEKVIRIQHPEAARLATASVLSARTDEVLPADSGANVIMAVVADDQTLVAGTTIALRITDSIRVNGALFEAGQLVYGTVSISNDRLLVHVAALREGRRLYTTDLQVYDLDGIAGIHIPGVLSRDVAKQSADQGVASLNVLTADPSLGAQAASAGIQTVKSFASRKVRQVRVSVPAGYQVLLRDAHARRVEALRLAAPSPVATVTPPDFTPAGGVVSSCRNEGVHLRLRGVWLVDGRLWFGLEYSNRSAIAFTPAYARWFIRDRRQVRRTAVQELALEPVSSSGIGSVMGDSTVRGWTGFEPFALEKDKELVLEVGEKGGGRVLSLRIDHKAILKAKQPEP